VTRKDIERIAIESNKLLPVELEALVSREEDASLRSPGTAAHYYRFLYLLTKELKPSLSVELGTHTGISAACLAEGYPEGCVITVDCIQRVLDISRRPNVEYFHQDSLKLLNIAEKSIDVFFSDTYHDGIKPKQEYELYLPYIKEGGILMFDDISLLPEMKVFWENFKPQGEKFELPVHGWAGFGIVIKDGACS